MCLISKSEKLHINIFPKTVYKVVDYIKEENLFFSQYKTFKYIPKKIYKISIEEIYNSSTGSFFQYRRFYVGFHSYNLRTAIFNWTPDYYVVKCRIPAFSRITKGINGDFLSNKIKLIKIIDL